MYACKGFRKRSYEPGSPCSVFSCFIQLYVSILLNKINDDDDDDDNVVVITETHFKQKHSDSVIAVPDYSAFRKDRVGRKGGGVAIYVRSSLQSLVW